MGSLGRGTFVLIVASAGDPASLMLVLTYHDLGPVMNQMYVFSVLSGWWVMKEFASVPVWFWAIVWYKTYSPLICNVKMAKYEVTKCNMKLYLLDLQAKLLLMSWDWWWISTTEVK